MQVAILPDSNFHVEVGPNCNAGHAYAAEVVTGPDPLTFLDLHAYEVAVEDEDVLFAARGVELSVEANDNRVSVEIVIGTEEIGIVGTGMDNFTGSSGEHGRADRIADVDTVMDSVAAAAGTAELIAGAVQLVESPWKRRLKPEVCTAYGTWRFKSRPEAAGAAWCTGRKAGIGANIDLERQRGSGFVDLFSEEIHATHRWAGGKTLGHVL